MKTFRIGGARVGCSDKADGNMKVFGGRDKVEVERNRRKFLSEMNLGVESTYFVRVDYGGEGFCKFARAGDGNGLRLDRDAAGCDGLLTSERGEGLFLPLADCVGMVLWDAGNETLMVVHCGRQTVLQDGAKKAVRYMAEVAGTKVGDLVAWLSPSAGGENYPLRDLDGVSLQEAVVEQLMRAGAERDNILASDVDTTLDENYFSHSQGDRRKRFAIVGVTYTDTTHIRHFY